MISSQEAFLMKLEEGIADELYSASCFENISNYLPEEYRLAFLAYSEDEKRHAEILKAIYMSKTGKLPKLNIPKVKKIDEVLLFLIDYKSEEEASIFLYESLYQFSKDEDEKEIFKNIKEEEEMHLYMVNKLISVYKERVLL